MLEVDPTVLAHPEDVDYDSTGYDISTASLSSSVNQYLYENGRRYHSYYGTDKNLMPTDEKEQDRLDLHHEIMRLCWNQSIYEAPLGDPEQILDIGTGTGIWAIEMADMFPNAEVIGTDLSPIQPDWVPSNCRFEVDDAMLEWTFQDNRFDFIHGRNISFGMSDWDHLASQMFHCTKPGGYVEISEHSMSVHCDDGSMLPSNGLKIFIDTIRLALTKIGRPPPDMHFIKQLLTKHGFVDVRAVQVQEPVGPWPRDPTQKRIGAMVMLNAETYAESLGMAAFTRILGMTVERAREVCDEGRKATRNKNYHMYGQYYTVYGRKPARYR